MEVVEESIQLKLEIEKIKTQFLQLLCSFDEPQPASLSDAQSYLKHLYQWKKRKSCNGNDKIIKSSLTSQYSKESPYLEHKPNMTKLQTNCEKSSKRANGLHVSNKTFTKYDETYQNKIDYNIKSMKVSSSNKENTRLTNLLPDSTMSWDTFMDMSILPRDSVVHDCDSYLHEENIFESTVNFPINSTILSDNDSQNSDDCILQSNKSISNESHRCKFENTLDKAYHPYKRTLPNLPINTSLHNKLHKHKHSDCSGLTQSKLQTENVNHFKKGLMSALNTCQFESFYNSIDSGEPSQHKKVSLRKQKAVSCLQSCIKSSKAKNTYSFPISSLLSCYDVGNNKTSIPPKELHELEKTMIECKNTSLKKGPMDFLCLPLLSS